jgi:hypothetical protein
VSQQINLFNPVLLRQKKYFSATTMMQALALILLGSLLVALYASFRLSGLQSAADQSSARLVAAQAQQARAMAEFGVRQSNPLLADELKKTSSEVQALQQVFDILQTGEIGNTDGYSGYLTAFARQITDGLWLTGFAIHGAGNEIALQGRTLRPELVPAYISRLTREPVMHGKSFSTLVMQQPPAASAGAAASAAAGALPANGYLEFRLQSAGIAPDAPDTAGSKLK